MSGTWNSASTTSTRSSEKYGLDENNTGSILVYKYRGGLGVSSQEELSKTVDKDPGLRVSRKRIPRGDSRIEVKTEDLYNEPERSDYQKYPNFRNSLASIGLPMGVYWKRLLFNQFQDLYIVSPETSPANSMNGSMQSSQRLSPSSTFDDDSAPTKEPAESAGDG